MASVAVKRKMNTKSIKEKYAALREIGEGLSKSQTVCGEGEFVLFFHIQPNKSLNLQSEICIGEKHSKIRHTGMFAANAAGDKISMIVIGKSKSPCCFKGIKHLTCRYRNKNKCWMDSVLFEECIREIDTKFTKEKKKVVFIIDSCPAHPEA
nr:tigger transposable element-derived protein 4-like [Hydra vulgaris]